MLEHIRADVWVRYQRMRATRSTSSAPTMPTARRSCLKLSSLVSPSSR
ncbi:hypothetical protein DMI70_18470 [Escherichia coli]|nr:hypothetical protein [Escherichia coli]